MKSEAGRPYLVEFKTEAQSALWTTLTNYPPMPLSGTNLVSDTEAASRRFYRASTSVE